LKIGASNFEHYIYIGGSKPNRRLFALLLLLTGCFYVFDMIAGGSAATFTLLFLGVTIWQALRTYVVRAIFMAEGIEYRSPLGRWQTAEYSSILILRDRGDSISVVGSDVNGRDLKITIRSLDGDLKNLSGFLDTIVTTGRHRPVHKPPRGA